MSSVVRQRQSLMFRARSYTGFVIMPRPPIVEWLADLDASLEQSKGFFAGYPIVVDLSAVTLSTNAIAQLARQPRGAQYPHPRHRRPRSRRHGAGPAADPARRSQYAVGRAVARRRAGRRRAGRAETATAVAPGRGPGALGANRGLHRRRHHRARLGRLGRRDRRRRIDPHLRHVARPRHGGRHRQLRGLASSVIASRPSCWRSIPSTRPPKTSTTACATDRPRPGSRAKR